MHLHMQTVENKNISVTHKLHHYDAQNFFIELKTQFLMDFRQVIEHRKCNIRHHLNFYGCILIANWSYI